MVTTRPGLSSLSLLQLTATVETVHKEVVWVFFIKQCSPNTQFSLSARLHSQIAACLLLVMTVVCAQNPFSGRDKSLLGLSVTWAHTPSSDLYAPPHGATETAHILLGSPPKVTENWDGLGNCCSHLLPIIHHNLVSHYYHRVLEEASHSTKSEGHKWAQSLCVTYVPKLWGGNWQTHPRTHMLPCTPRAGPVWLFRAWKSTNIQPWIGLRVFLYCRHTYLLQILLELLSLPEKGESHCKHYFSMSLMMTDLAPPSSLVLSLYDLRVRVLNIVRPFQQPSCGAARKRTYP